MLLRTRTLVGYTEMQYPHTPAVFSTKGAQTIEEKGVAFRSLERMAKIEGKSEMLGVYAGCFFKECARD